jgi:hypothetical protein
MVDGICRLFVLLPQQLAYEKVEASSNYVVGLNQLLKFLAANFDE